MVTPAADTLGTMAEIAISLAGFSGLVTAFRSQGALTAEELRRIIYILFICLVVVLTSLLPSALVALGISEPMAYRCSLSIIAVAMLSISINTVLAWFGGKITFPFPRVSIVLIAGNSMLVIFLLTVGLFASIQAYAGILLVVNLFLLLVTGWAFISTIIWYGSRGN